MAANQDYLTDFLSISCQNTHENMQKDKNLAPALSTKDKRRSVRVQRDFPLTASLVERDWETFLDAQTLLFEPEQPHNPKQEDFDSPITCPEL